MASKLYIQYLVCISIFVLVIYWVSLIKTFVLTLGSILFVLIISWRINNYINKYLKHTISSNGKAVIITGCDTGFGNAIAIRLNELGFYVIATCLNPNSDTSKKLISSALYSDRIITIELDVTKHDDIEKVYSKVLNILSKNNLKLWALLNNAGIFQIGFAEWGSIDAYKSAFDVNVLGSVRMTRMFLPLIEDSGGRLVFTSSVASRIAIDGYSAYCMSKHALLAFCDCLRKEMSKFGVKVITIEPSCYRTPMASVESVSELQDKTWNQTPEQIRECYGKEFFENFKLSYNKQAEQARDPREVSNAMVDAVMNEKPNVRYKCCGIIADIIWSLAEVLPSEIFDDMISTITKYERVLSW